jgi:type 1 glutamine amidotransferase
MRKFPVLIMGCLMASLIFTSPVRAGEEAKDLVAAAPAKKMVVFIAGRPSHGFAQHEHNAGCLLLARLLKEGMPNFDDRVYTNGWPTDPHALDGADAIVMYCDGGPGHMVIPHLDEVDALTKKGVGIGCIHYAVEIPKDKGGKQFLDWIGGYFEAYWSVNPVWQADFAEIPKHPVTNGVKPFANKDEFYYHMRFRPNMDGVTPIIYAVPPDSTRMGKDDAHGGNPAVRADIGKSLPETIVWVSENKETTNRGFGCTGGHYHWNWAQDDFRKCILNCIVWIAKGDVPPDGVPSKRPTVDELLANQDKKVPADFDRAKIEAQIEAMNAPHEK